MHLIQLAIVLSILAVSNADPIDKLVQELSSSHGLWSNGGWPRIDLPATASNEEVVTKALSFNGYRLTRIVEARQVKINEGSNKSWTVVLVETGDTRHIVILQQDTHGWLARTMNLVD